MSDYDDLECYCDDLAYDCDASDDQEPCEDDPIDFSQKHWKKQIYANTTFALKDSGSYHFLVTQQRGPFYQQHCAGVVAPEDPIRFLRQYAEHTTELYAQVNLSLASDSAVLEQHGPYIQNLRAAVLQRPLLDDAPLYRGVNLSRIETDEMERLQHFFIPSFTSTSVERGKVYEKNSVLVIKTPYLTRYACSMTEECSEYFLEEREVLVACYSAFYLERVELVNGKNYLTLFLDEMCSSAERICWGRM
eukprot:TRINITY_DN5291_c0_g1_i1.p1 TRINITY_DN5291_c0_g1~~TRINITY_DN5291_c0_g1_i1.p1  ORF type:complete len:248 (+),score=49.45 TRINITY_DN5291_c0_g1_i1:41-784(+)